jgi:hypothetical protein
VNAASAVCLPSGCRVACGRTWAYVSWRMGWWWCLLVGTFPLCSLRARVIKLVRPLVRKASAGRVPGCALDGLPAPMWWRGLRAMAAIGSRCYTAATRSTRARATQVRDGGRRDGAVDVGYGYQTAAAGRQINYGSSISAWNPTGARLRMTTSGKPNSSRYRTILLTC